MDYLELSQSLNPIIICDGSFAKESGKARCAFVILFDKNFVLASIDFGYAGCEQEAKASDCSTTWSSPQSFPPPPPPHHDQSELPPPPVIRPCGACKTLRRGCVPRCVLAPYFPPNQPLKFLAVHRVFGASNVVKILQELPESQKADAVDSLVYEAVARIKDPVHGCAGEVCRLQKLVRQLQMQLATAQAQVLNTVSYQQESFSCDYNSLICTEKEAEAQQEPLLDDDFMLGTPNFQIYDCFSCNNSFFPSNTNN
ncbi:LOB domain-containing protein 1-like [Telopea speciosissima]|uniref:LOB domain-containing protein 1-like n=1 Tax=Telopea speciosissima TaxID=54955 RepID=UPI001CC551FA|nr:LOB domain-containing protein 1-like [Telopea speciosissima]